MKILLAGNGPEYSGVAVSEIAGRPWLALLSAGVFFIVRMILLALVDEERRKSAGKSGINSS